MIHIHHIYYMRNGELREGNLAYGMTLAELTADPQSVWSCFGNHHIVQPLEIARGMAEHARLEAKRASREGCMGAIIGERDWGKEAALWMAEVRRLEQQ